MAIITEEEEPLKESPSSNTIASLSTTPSNTSNSTPPRNSTQSPSPSPNPFIFWFYFTLIITLIAFFFSSISSSISTQDPKSWFLGLPNDLRHHYSKGRTIKVQPSPNHSPIELFSIEDGPIGDESVVFVHGLGLSSFAFRETVRSLSKKGIRAIAIDLPGSGFSDKSTAEVGKGRDGVFSRFWDVYGVIQDKGLFWAFDEIIGSGEMPYEQIEKWASNQKIVRVLELGPVEIGKVLGQVIASMKASPVNLVLHDSSLSMCANWILDNSKSVRSITLLDTSSRSMPALPLWALKMPLIRETVLGFSGAYSRFVNQFCLKSVSNVEAHRVLVKGKDGTKALLSMANMLNHSFDLAEWGDSRGLKGLPIHVLWSSSWSEEWSKEGLRVAGALPQAKFAHHSAGRWPQDDTSEELAEKIVQFISSLPQIVKQVEEESIPQHIQKMFDEAKTNDHVHHHGHGDDHHHHDGHAHMHMHGADLMDAYGLGHGFAT